MQRLLEKIAVREKSRQIYEDSCAVIPAGVNSPVRSFPGLSLAPLIADSGKNDTIWDADGNSYIDYCGSWGSLILGHAHDAVVAAACQQVKRGSSFGMATEIELKLARCIVDNVPSVEKIRFVSSGTEASMSAIRLARGFTNRSLIVKFNGNYHGHVDSLLIKAGSGVAHLNTEASSKGVPPEMVKNTVSLPFNDTPQVRAFLQSHAVAAVIIEPIAGNIGVVPATPEFLFMLREETLKSGAILIFDEVITGFRVGLQGAQGYYGIIPDLTCFGKIIGGGFPAAAFGGRAEIMDHLAPLGQVYQAGTLSGNPVAMHAGYAALAEVQKPGFYAQLESKTKFLTEPIKQALKGKGCLQEIGSMFSLFFGIEKASSSEDLEKMDKEQFKRLFLFLFERGIYIPPSPYETWFVSEAHTLENLARTRDAILEFLSHGCIY